MKILMKLKHAISVYTCFLVLLCTLVSACRGDKVNPVNDPTENLKHNDMKKIITTAGAPAAIGPYSQAVEADGMSVYKRSDPHGSGNR